MKNGSTYHLCMETSLLSEIKKKTKKTLVGK